MFLYFNKNGQLVEIINDDVPHKGSVDYDKLFVYVEGYNVFPNTLWTTFEASDGTRSIETQVSLGRAKEIPYNKKRDLKCFEYFKPYQFFEVSIPENINVINGLTLFSGRLELSNSTIKALDIVPFEIKNNLIAGGDTCINENQYNYLLKLINEFKNEISMPIIISANQSINDVLDNVKTEGVYRVIQEKSKQYTENDYLSYVLIVSKVNNEIIQQLYTFYDYDLAPYDVCKMQLRNFIDGTWYQWENYHFNANGFTIYDERVEYNKGAIVTLVGNGTYLSKIDRNIYNPTQNPFVWIKLDDVVLTSIIGEPDGIASLDENGKVPSTQLPDGIGLQLGETSTTAYAGDKGKKNKEDITKINASKGQPNGLATLDSTGKVPNEQLPDITISAEKLKPYFVGDDTIIVDIAETNTQIEIHLDQVFKESLASKTYVNDAISGVSGFNIKIVDSLPTTGDKNTFYFVKKVDAKVNDTYEEYMYIENKWELLGSTKIDLSDYAKITYVNTELAKKVNVATEKSVLHGTNERGQESTTQYDKKAIGNTIAQRNGDGSLEVGTPTQVNDATPKKYVDDKINVLMPKHTYIGDIYLNEFFRWCENTPSVVDGALFKVETETETPTDAINRGFPLLQSGSVLYGYFYNGMDESPIVIMTDKGNYKITNGASELTCVKLGGGEAVIINQPSSATNGNLTSTQLAKLKKSDLNYIVFANEIYLLMDKTHTADTLTYSHLGYENNKHQVKTISITISTLAWVLNESEIGAGANFHFVGKLPELNDLEYNLHKIYNFGNELYFIANIDISVLHKTNITGGRWGRPFYGIKDNKIYYILDYVWEYNTSTHSASKYTSSTSPAPLKGNDGGNYTQVEDDIYCFSSVGQPAAKFNITSKTFTTITLPQIGTQNLYFSLKFAKDNIIYLPFPIFSGDPKKEMYKWDVSSNAVTKIIIDTKGDYPKFKELIVIGNDVYFVDNYLKICKVNLLTNEYTILRKKNSTQKYIILFTHDDKYLYITTEDFLTLRYDMTTNEEMYLSTSLKGTLTPYYPYVDPIVISNCYLNNLTFALDKEKVVELDFKPSFKWKKITSTDVA